MASRPLPGGGAGSQCRAGPEVPREMNEASAKLQFFKLYQVKFILLVYNEFSQYRI